MNVDLPLMLEALNVLIVPVLVFVHRIDRRQGQLDTLQKVDSRNVENLQRAARDFETRLTRLECK